LGKAANLAPIGFPTLLLTAFSTNMNPHELRVFVEEVEVGRSVRK
jgi:hypothetical protein